jgi:hypothetical protein
MRKLNAEIKRDRDGLWIYLFYDSQTKVGYPIKAFEDLETIKQAIITYQEETQK